MAEPYGYVYLTFAMNYMYVLDSLESLVLPNGVQNSISLIFVCLICFFTSH